MPGYSEHELGTAIDISLANRVTMYAWLTGLNQAGLPPIIRHGFIPTVRHEPWHYRYVGIEKAKVFWQKHRDEVWQKHTRRLRRR
ncbi:MAG: hypothetical protein HY984_02500 [Candidatus Magasanikbacteria bacterium]|nr:hypothetical protein [Candidatus Magasanikbacteria bacterium]